MMIAADSTTRFARALSETVTAMRAMPLDTDAMARFTRSFETVSRALIETLKPLAARLADDPYRRAGYPYGKSMRGRKKWMKRLTA